jgi:hypothetical protein
MGMKLNHSNLGRNIDVIFLNRMLRKIFGRNENEVTQKWEIQYNEEIYELYFSPNIIRVTKSRRMRWVW